MAGQTNTAGRRKTEAEKAAEKDKIVPPKNTVEVAVAQAPAPDNPVSVIAAAVLGVMQAVFNVEKRGENDFFKYSYAKEGDLLAALRPEMIKQGLILIPNCTDVRPCDQHGTTVIVQEYSLVHVSGAIWPEKIRAPGAGNDKSTKGGVGDKGVYKALTGAHKYLLMKLFQIATGDDPEAQDLGHLASDRPNQGGQQGGQQRGGGRPPSNMMKLSEEEEFKQATLYEINKRVASRSELNSLMQGEVKLNLERVGPKTRKAIDDRARERYKELPREEGQGGDQRQGRQDDRRSRDVPVTSGTGDDRRDMRRDDRRDERDGDDRWPPGDGDEAGEGDGRRDGDYGNDHGYGDGDIDDAIPE